MPAPRPCFAPPEWLYVWDAGPAPPANNRQIRMKLYFRLIRILLVALMRPRLGILEESVVDFRVWPNDLDVNLHMNNGRYLTIMDLGRVDLIVRVGLMRLIIRRRWAPVVGMATIRFRKSLTPFQKYRLKTRVVCWNDKWTYIEQHFEAGDEIVALAYVKTVFRAGKRTLRSREVLRALGQEQRSPPMPPAIEALKLAEGLTGEKPGRV